MCTLTIFSSQRHKIITMNRDEQRSRHETNEIIKKNSGKTNYYHPVDQLSGGTWFGFSNEGFVMAILNRYQDKNIKANTSRGIIIPSLLPLNSHEEILDKLHKLILSRFQPFDLVVSGLNSTNRFSWNGLDLTISEIPEDEPFILTSSSVDSEKILIHRSILFNEFSENTPDPKADRILRGFHLNQDKKDTSSSVYMSREITHTKSISQVTLDTNQLHYDYYTEQNLTFDNHSCQTISLNLNC